MNRFDIVDAKKILGIDVDTSVHFCQICHDVWECDCHMCCDDKRMMCFDCWGRFCTGGVTEQVDNPPRLVSNAYC